MARSNAASDLAQRVFDEFRHSDRWKRGYARLESYQALGRRFGVSQKTIAAAVRHLDERNCLIKQTSRCIYLVDPQRFASVHDRIHNHPAPTVCQQEIEGMCRKGFFKAGTQLPKISYFTESFGVSPQTVIQALRALEKKGVVQKKGKKWMAGRAPVEAPRTEREIIASYRTSGPEVIVVCRDLNRYHLFSSLEIFKPCIDTLYRRLMINGIRYTIVYTKELPAAFNCLCGLDRIDAYIQESLPRIRGIIVVGYAADTYDETFFARFSRFGKPLLVFDPSFRPSKPLAAFINAWPNCSVLTVDARTAVRLNLEHLYRLGHTRIGVPIPYSAYRKPWNRRWIDYRIELLQKTARSIGQGITVFTARKHGHREQIGDFVAACGGKGFQGAPGKDLPIIVKPEYVEEHIASLTYLLGTRNATAIVALHDDAARHYYTWAASRGIGIPDEFSLVSFDNTRYAEALGVTSVDFGLDFGGHEAAGLFIEEASAREHSQKVFTGRPWLIVRGSTEREARK